MFDLRDELKLFFELEKKTEFASLLKNDRWIRYLAYMVDIFDHMNILNLKMQGKNTNTIQFYDILKAFMSKLGNWKRKVRTNKVVIFEELSPILKLMTKNTCSRIRKKNRFCNDWKHQNQNSLTL